jgi:hypothetical protein
MESFMLIDLDEHGIGVYFRKPWMRTIIRAAWEKGEMTSAEAWGLVYLAAPRSTVIAFMNRCVRDGILGKEPSPKSGKTGLEFLYKAQPLALRIDWSLPPSEDGFKNYLFQKLSAALKKEGE